MTEDRLNAEGELPPRLPPRPPIAAEFASSGSRLITPGTGGVTTPTTINPPEQARTVVEKESVARPVEALLRDPLSEVARKERRSLLGISALAILVGWTGLVPQKIENLGLTFSVAERKAVLWVFMGVVVYYTVAFIVYAMNDFLTARRAVYIGRQELRKQRREQNLMEKMRSAQDADDERPWRMIVLVSPVSILRGILEFAVPIAVASYAIWALYGAIGIAAQRKIPTPQDLKDQYVECLADHRVL
jgi:hypothetical protein